jgi:hypothetical protein
MIAVTWRSRLRLRSDIMRIESTSDMGGGSGLLGIVKEKRRTLANLSARAGSTGGWEVDGK